MDTIRYQLKTMNRQYGLYTKTKTALKNNLIALLDQTYPGANALFSSPAREDGSQKWVDFVASFWHVDCVLSMSQTIFTELYRKWCKRHGYCFQTVKAAQIYSESKDLIAMLQKDSLSKMLIQQAIDQLNSASKTVALLRREMKGLAQELPEYPVVMDMYDTLGPQLMAEIGDVMRFERRSALTAFAGVDPGTNQSGTYEAKSIKSSKRDAPELRKTLLGLYDRWCQQVFSRLLQQGKGVSGLASAIK